MLVGLFVILKEDGSFEEIIMHFTFRVNGMGHHFISLTPHFRDYCLYIDLHLPNKRFIVTQPDLAHLPVPRVLL